MGLLFSERRDLSNIWYWTIVVVLAFAAIGVAGQTTPTLQNPTPPAAQEKPTSPTVEEKRTGDNASVDVQRRFNDLRRELLDYRAETINWWLAATAIFLTFFGIVVVLGGYFGFGRFREIEAEVKKYAEEIKELNKQAKEDAQQIGQERERITKANILDDDPDKAKQTEEASRDIPQKPAASPLDRAITEAFSLQRAGKIEEALEKWRSIANVAEGSDPDLAARAWLSIGSLLYEKEVEDAGEQ